jgi:hypothetical protein
VSCFIYASVCSQPQRALIDDVSGFESALSAVTCSAGLAVLHMLFTSKHTSGGVGYA